MEGRAVQEALVVGRARRMQLESLPWQLYLLPPRLSLGFVCEFYQYIQTSRLGAKGYHA